MAVLCGNSEGMKPVQASGPHCEQTYILFSPVVKWHVWTRHEWTPPPPQPAFYFLCWEELKCSTGAHVSARSTGLNGIAVVVVCSLTSSSIQSIVCVVPLKAIGSAAQGDTCSVVRCSCWCYPQSVFCFWDFVIIFLLYTANTNVIF